MGDCSSPLHQRNRISPRSRLNQSPHPNLTSFSPESPALIMPPYAPVTFLHGKPSHTFGYYLVLLTLVTPIRAIVYLSPLLLLFTLLRPFISFLPSIHSLPTPFHTPLTVYTAMETIFLLYHTFSLSALQEHHTPPPTTHRMDLFRRIRAELADHPTFVSRWFFGADPTTISRVDIESWLSWAFFCKESDALTVAEETELRGMVETLEKDSGHTFVDGGGKERVKAVRNTFDPVECMARPLIYYLVIHAVDALCAVILRAWGFQRLKAGCLPYWIREPISRSAKMQSEKSENPIVFVHGIGAGLATYLSLVWALLIAHPSRTIVLPELPHISMRLMTNVPTSDDTLAGVDVIYSRHGFKTATWMGHSLGSLVVSWMCQRRKQRVASAVLIDPVVFMLWESDVAYNFLYRQPAHAVDLLMYYFVSQELYISYYLHRHFWWYENVLFPDHLPPLSKVFLSAEDTIIASKRVKVYLKQNGVDVHSWERTKHGEFEFSLKMLREVVAAVE